MDDFTPREAPETEDETLFGYPVIYTDADITEEDWTSLVLGDWSCWVQYVWKPKAARAEKRQP